MKPIVTIVIPFYNDPYIAEAVESALAQTYEALEIIVVDDGSTQYADLLLPYVSRIHYLGKGNGGTASALNHGFRYANGQYIAWLSSDDRFYPEKVEKQVAAMQREGAWISHTSFNRINAQGDVTLADVTPPEEGSAAFYYSLRDGNPINGCTVMMRKKLFERIGNFDESLPYTHDLDYWYRVLLAGFPFQLIREPLTAYRWHDQMGTLRFKEAIQSEALLTRMRYKHRWNQRLYRLGLQP